MKMCREHSYINAYAFIYSSHIYVIHMIYKTSVSYIYIYMRKTYIKSRKRSITNLYIPVLTSTIINMWTIVFHLYPHPQEYFEANCRHPIISSINISIRVPVINLTFLCAKPTLLCSSVWFCSWTLEPFLFCQLARCEALSLENTWVTLEEERASFPGPTVFSPACSCSSRQLMSCTSQWVSAVPKCVASHWVLLASQPSHQWVSQVPSWCLLMIVYMCVCIHLYVKHFHDSKVIATKNI